MPHAKQMRSGAHLPEGLVVGQRTTTDSVSEEPAQIGTAGSIVQPTVTGVWPLYEPQTHTVQHKSSSAHPGSKALPVLPWMRVPISIEGGTGVSLQQVIGLHPLALAVLQAGVHYSPDLSRAVPLWYYRPQCHSNMLFTIQGSTQSSFLCKLLPGVS